MDREENIADFVTSKIAFTYRLDDPSRESSGPQLCGVFLGITYIQVI